MFTERDIVARVMKEIGEIVKNIKMEVDYIGFEETRTLDIPGTFLSLGKALISRAEEIKEDR